MSARRHLCCYINEDTSEGCDEVATQALGYYNLNVDNVYSCTDHAAWLPKQWNGGSDPLYYRLVDGFDPMMNSNEEIRAARQVLVKAGVIRVG